jgi:DNA-binding transcriptional regulator LsrR (DeoR family)
MMPWLAGSQLEEAREETRHHLPVMYYASWSQIARVVGIPRVEVDEAVTRLQAEGVIAIGVPMDGLPGT